jgi:hypothetical protein
MLCKQFTVSANYGVVIVKVISPGTTMVPNKGSATEMRKFTPKSDELPEEGEAPINDTIELGRLPSDNVVKLIGFAAK